MTPLDKLVTFLVFVALAVLIAFALRSNARAHGDGRGEA